MNNNFGQRQAIDGELCTCGRQAVTVFGSPDRGEVGYCGIPDGGQRSTACTFCGGERHDGRCPQYQLRLSASSGQ
jgi:hypothetical protein